MDVMLYNKPVFMHVSTFPPVTSWHIGGDRFSTSTYQQIRKTNSKEMNLCWLKYYLMNSLLTSQDVMHFLFLTLHPFNSMASRHWS